MLIFLELDQSLVLCGPLCGRSIQAIGNEVQKRGDRWRPSSGNELEAFQKLTKPPAISATAVRYQLNIGRSFAIATAAAANGLNELIRAGRWRQNHGDLGCLRKALIQFGPTCRLVVGKQNDFGLTRRIHGLIITVPDFESLAGFLLSQAAIDKPCHFLEIS